MERKHSGTIADRVRERRTDLGMTQNELAEKLGRSQQYVARLESGKTRQPRNLGILADVLQVSEAWLQFGRTDLDQLSEDAIDVALLSMKLSARQRQALIEYLRSSTDEEQESQNAR